MTYSIHNEWTDGTFEADNGGITYRTKREAVRIARHVAKSIGPHSDVARILVCDADLTTIAAFEARTGR